MSDDAIAAGLVDAARRAVEHAQDEPPEPHGDPLADVVPTEAAPKPPPQRPVEGPDETGEGEDRGQIDADDASADSYTTAQAARLLGLSDRRVRQLIAEGRLVGEADAAGVLHLPQQVVHEERARRRKADRPPQPDPDPGRKRAPSATGDADVIAAAVAAAVAQVLAGQRELTAQASSLVEAERARADAERARRMALEEELLDLRRRVAESPAPARRRWWGR